MIALLRLLLAEHEAHYIDLFNKIGGCAVLCGKVADVHLCMFVTYSMYPVSCKQLRYM